MNRNSTHKSITTIEMCLATKCRNSADPESPSPILQKARSSYDLSVTQCLSDLAAGRTTFMDLNHCETEEQERTQFVPHADETKDLTETIDKYFGGLTDEFPFIKEVTSEAVMHNMGESEASLKCEEERRMTNKSVTVDSGPLHDPINEFGATNRYITHTGHEAAERDFRDDEFKPPPPPLPVPPRPPPQIPAPSVVSDCQVQSYPPPLAASAGHVDKASLFRGFAFPHTSEKLSSAMLKVLPFTANCNSINFSGAAVQFYPTMLQSVVSVSIRSPDDDADGDPLRLAPAAAHLGERQGGLVADCAFPAGECSRCGSRSRSASPRGVGALGSREASPFTYSTRIIHRQGTPRRRRRTGTKVN